MYLKKLKIGNVELENNLILAPMAGVTDLPFRIIYKKYGNPGLVCNEMVSAKAICFNDEKTKSMLVTNDQERPVSMQIFGHEPDSMATATIEVSKMADIIDINFGCPVNKIAGRGAGSGMMRYPDKMVEITKSVVDAVKLPVTVKTRLGWDENSKIIVELAERLQDVGIAALTVHGRTRCQMYKGEADWTLIGKIKENPRMHIPIIGNGDITDGPGAKAAFERYGVDGIMIGRATYGRPWIFKEIKHYLKYNEPMVPLTLDEKVDLAKKHFCKSVSVKGDRVGVLEMRRHLSNYFKCIPNFKETRLKLVTTNEPEQILELLEYIRETFRDVPMNQNVTSIYEDK